MTPLTSSTRARRWPLVVATVVASAWSCMTVTDVELLEISATGVIFGQAFLDRNGSGVADAGDTPLRLATVQVVTPGTSAVAATDTTDTLGVFILRDVPVGAYQVRLSLTVLGDLLQALGTGGNVTVEVGDTTLFSLGATYPTMTLAEVLAAPPGKRVFTSGIALNPRQFNGDGLVFFKGPTSYLRGTNVDRVTLAPGDSLRLLGRTAVSHGRPALDAVTPIVLVPSAQFPLPVEVSAAAARLASGGTLDAALVRIRDADIKDTATVANDFRFWAHNGGDSVEVVLRSYLTITPAPAIRPDTIVAVSQATGLLSPFDDGSGTVRWRLLVRSASEITTFNKAADVAVSTSFDTLAASAGDTVDIIVTVRNASGPQIATGVEVTDTVPSALTFLSSTATRGSYSQATRIWSVGNLPVGAPADTLRILATVTGAPGNVSNTARLRPLRREVETNAGNNTAVTFPFLVIS
ncbi:MAG: DUF11 domain-containing protein [Gemmatimonadetes bacterium]|nr:DUF11 domain-containing protein [Gemmatimonadota bacterium]